MKVVVIDDSDVYLQIAGEALKAAGLEFVGLSTALGGVRQVVSADPDVVLIDMDMPALSGENAATIMKKQRALAGTVIVLHSDRDEKEMLAAMRRCGADGFLRKTADKQLFVDEVKRLGASSNKVRRASST